MKTSIRLYSVHDVMSNTGDISVETGVSFDPDTDICAGGGFGAILITCKETVGGEQELDGAQNYEVSSAVADATNEISNSYSIKWSYTTSDNPEL